MEQEAGCTNGKDAPIFDWTRHAVCARKTRLAKLKDLAFFRDVRQEGPRHLSVGLYIQQLCVSQLEAAVFTMDALLSLS